MRSGELYEHPTWALPTAENGCSSLLPTPETADGTGGRNAKNLRWEGNTAYRPSGAKASVSLQETVAMLPTPTVGDSKSARNSTAKRHKLPPTGVHIGDTLTDIVSLLPTPRTSDANGGGAHGDGGLDLRTVIADTAVAGPQGDTGRPLQHGEPAEVDWAAYEPAIRRWERLTRPAPSPVDAKGRLSPKFVEWMQGFEDGFVTDLVGRTAALKALGNTVVPQVSEWVGRQIKEIS